MFFGGLQFRFLLVDRLMLVIFIRILQFMVAVSLYISGLGTARMIRYAPHSASCRPISQICHMFLKLLNLEWLQLVSNLLFHS